MGTSKYQKKSKLSTASADFSSGGLKRLETAPIEPVQETQIEMAINEYVLDKQAHGLSDATIRSYKTSLESVLTFIPEQTKHKPLNEWTQPDLDEIHVAIQKGKQAKKDKPLAKKTVETYLRNFRQLVTWLTDAERLYMASNLHVKSFRAPQAQPKMYTKEEIYALSQPPKALERMTFTELRNYVMTIVLIETGVRRNSLINIKIEDVDIKQRQIQIAQSKNKNVYMVAITQKTADILQKYLTIRAPYMGDVSEHEKLFCDEYQRPLTLNGISTIMRKYVESRGVKNRGIHSFRHSCATMMKQNGASIAEIAQQTGHKDLRQVDGYVHAVTSLPQDKISRLSPLSNAPRPFKTQNQF
jgi:integrase/recombinase XerD